DPRLVGADRKYVLQRELRPRRRDDGRLPDRPHADAAVVAPRARGEPLPRGFRCLRSVTARNLAAGAEAVPPPLRSHALLSRPRTRAALPDEHRGEEAPRVEPVHRSVRVLPRRLSDRANAGRMAVDLP